ncbi:MAG: ferritin-like domain-containing protein [Myxococcales bacterium]|nr:ferritin-like domain-containing protein [Myxococcales bacterium]
MRNVGAAIAMVVGLVGVTGAGACLPVGTSSCDGLPPDRNVDVSPTEACALMAKGNAGYSTRSIACPASCQDRSACLVDEQYASAFRAANPDAGAPGGGDASADAGAPAATCPTVPSGKVAIVCSTFCEGRRTEGVEPVEGRADSLGAYFASCAWLEATSVFAFARLHEELSAHGAPDALLARIDLARREEERHVELTRGLARRFGVEPSMPGAPPSQAPRSVEAIARENAVEGCIRETWGAALARLRATRALDPEVRAVAEAIAADEASHAQLAWDLHAWLSTRLDGAARASVEEAMRDTVAELAMDELDTPALAALGMPSRPERGALVDLLDRHVFRAAA